MSDKIIFLGSTGEVGANSIYLYLDGTGILIDAGLHPTKRDATIFPSYTTIQDEPTDALIITHAHTDHIGAIPYALKIFPHLKLYATKASCDLLGIMLKDTAKLMKTEIIYDFTTDVLSLYHPDILSKVELIVEPVNYLQKLELLGMSGRSDVGITLYRSGHILGSSSVLIEHLGTSIFATSDVNFADQKVITGAELPSHHLDCLIIEATNAGNQVIPEYKNEIKRLGQYINQIADKNGSVLIPAFALGKSQETLKVIYDLMVSNKIPTMPIYTAGLQNKISVIYDRHCYGPGMMNPGFEISDIPRSRIQYDKLFTGDYFKEPSIVLVTSGMMNPETLSYKLAPHWFRRKNYGIAIIGYTDPQSPAYAVQHSEMKKEFVFGTKNTNRICEVETFKLTSHALLEDSLAYITKVKPKLLFIVHGDIESCENLAEHVKRALPQTTVVVPDTGDEYVI